jgi:hypothetical protein
MEKASDAVCMWIIGGEGIYGVGISGARQLTPEDQQRIERDFPEAALMEIHLFGDCEGTWQ